MAEYRNMAKRLWILVVIVFGGLFCLSYLDVESTQENFLDWEGERVLHTFNDTADASSDQQIIELQDANGMPLWFGRHFYKDVCISGKCKMIRLWLFWDGAGNYLGFQVPEDEPLTKSDHTIFEHKDYIKLDDILKDPSSILKKLKQEDLVIIPDSIKNPYELDGYTAATQPALAEVVVKDAVYSCHTLWHTVYGPTQQEIFRLLDERTDADFLTQMLSSNKSEKIIWAIETIEKHREYHAEFYPRIIIFIKSEDDLLAETALDYFQKDELKDEQVKKQLVDEMPFFSARTNVELIWRLIENGGVLEEIFLQLLRFVKEGKLQVTSLNLVYQLYQPDFFENREIETLLNNFLKDKDAYVRTLTQKVLEIK
ncbi:hypothetical protein [uncultured Draconibacterium sp.]|uniref:hypothetical protein n=1 Tax=uncultured Draconibacterium sp. TaxID=1573823 RepID=UPI0025E3A95E|nr:hypothetical protein [uncultured Draconibacterium sp.]